MTVPAVFKDSQLWFRLWQAAVRCPDVREPGGNHKPIYMLMTMIDGALHYIRFAVQQGPTPLTFYVVIDGPEVGKYMAGSSLHGVGFSIAYNVTWKAGAGVEAIDPRYAVNRGAPMRFITKKYASRSLPSFYEKADRDAIEHVVMMFVLSLDGAKS